MEIFKTKIVVTSQKVADECIRLEELGIKTSIDAEDVKYVNAWIRIDRINFVEETGKGDYDIYLSDGNVLNAKDNPFEKFQ
jgi:hypothetical protein